MKWNKGQVIEGRVCISGRVSEQVYRVRILELLYESTNFYYYKGEDQNKTFVCLKTIRYCPDKSSLSPLEYLKFRRKQLFSEQQLLSISHPCFPESLALFVTENACPEDEQLWQDPSQWQELQREEPVLVMEYFAGTSLDKHKEVLQLSFRQKVHLVKKALRLCAYLHRDNYIAACFEPQHLLFQAGSECNLQLTGFHHCCSSRMENPEEKQRFWQHFFPQVKPAELCEQGRSVDQRLDVFQVGLLLYFLVTGEHLGKSNHWLGKNKEFSLEKQKTRIEKSLSHSEHKKWVWEFLLRTAHFRPEFRIAELSILLRYLEKPPREKIHFHITKATDEQIELTVSQIPAWAERLLVKLELLEEDKIWQKSLPVRNLVSLPGLGSGQVVCTLLATNGKDYSWSHTQEAFVLPDLQLRPLENLPANKFGFRWHKNALLDYVSFYRVDRYGKKQHLADSKGTEIVLPEQEKQLPLYEILKIECASFFHYQGKEVRGPVSHHQVYLLSPLPPLEYKRVRNGLWLQVVFSPEESKRYSQIELLHNGWSQAPDEEHQDDHHQRIISFFIAEDHLSLFEAQRFATRIWVEELGWINGPSREIAMEPPAVTNLKIAQNSDVLDLKWAPIEHFELVDYEIVCQNELVARTKNSFYSFRLPTQAILQARGQKMEVAVSAVYSNQKSELKSAPCQKQFLPSGWEKLLACQVKYHLSPLGANFSLQFPEREIKDSHLQIMFVRRESEEVEEVIAMEYLQPEVFFNDSNVEVGKVYQYAIKIEELNFCLFEKRLEIPRIDIRSSLKFVDFNECCWEIYIPAQTRKCLPKEIEVHRIGKNSHSQKLLLHEDQEEYQFRDQQLMPGHSYLYELHFSLDHQDKHKHRLGEVTTRKFALQEKIEVSYNRATVSWSPTPRGKIDCIEIYDQKGRFLSSTKSDYITLENLEPERNYVFPLKYRYPNQYVEEGPTLAFTTQEYHIPVEVTRESWDSYRLKWEIPDLTIAAKIKEFVLRVSEDVGEHTLTGATRSVVLKQLQFATEYQWSLHARFKSSSRCALAQGEIHTDKPELDMNVEVGLVHHLTWDYPKSAGISKVEVHRDDLALIATDNKELYDSDFKGGKPVTYKFYYLTTSGSKILAKQQQISPLSMKDLFGALDIQEGVGYLTWNFEGFKKLPYLDAIELHRDGQLVYQERKQPNMIFRDEGEWDLENNKRIGLTDDEMDFELSVIGVAPTVRKCKKRWTLSIKGIRCQYPDLPENFQIFSEYNCVFFHWDKINTPFLEEIIVRDLEEGKVLYRGKNEPSMVCFDDNGRGLVPGQTYECLIEMNYSNFQTQRVITFELEDFDPRRLQLQEKKLTAGHLEIHWNKDIPSTIAHIGWRRYRKGQPSFLARLQRTKFVPFSQGILTIPVSGETFLYQLIYRDQHGNIFSDPPRELCEIPSSEQENTLTL